MDRMSVALRPRGRPPVSDDEVMLRVLRTLHDARVPLWVDDLRATTRGQSGRIDRAIRMLFASGLIYRTKFGFILSPRGKEIASIGADDQ
jgi:hypothetical protein